VKVSSVISQYTRLASVNAGLGANTGIAGDNTATVGGRMSWMDRPTITYLPISGQEFSKNLLTPLPPEQLFRLMLSGWPIELVIRNTTWSVNQIDNDVARPSRRRHAEPELAEFFAIWRELTEVGAIDIRIQRPEQDKAGKLILFFRALDNSESDIPGMDRFRRLIEVGPDVTEFRLIYGLVPQEPGDIAILTGSIWEIMLNLAWQFEVPQEHVESGMTGETFRSKMFAGVPPIRLNYSKDYPEDAFVAVRSQDYWFFIDRTDRGSKRVFSFLQLLLSLAETEMPDMSPVISISN
jgi:hypothetical protein